jgi:hypothetical protein
MDNLNNKLSDEAQSQPSCLGAVTGSAFNITCQSCGKDCDTYEEVNTAQIGEELEMWCYCRDCDIETFH